MKKFAFICAVFLSAVVFAAEVPFFAAAPKSPVLGVSFAEKGDTLALAFKLPDNTANDFSLINIYLFADSDRNTGRKNMGNEYYFDIPKAMISTYAADGKGTLHRNALNHFRSGEWYIITTP